MIHLISLETLVIIHSYVKLQEGTNILISTRDKYHMEVSNPWWDPQIIQTRPFW